MSLRVEAIRRKSPNRATNRRAAAILRRKNRSLDPIRQNSATRRPKKVSQANRPPNQRNATAGNL